VFLPERRPQSRRSFRLVAVATVGACLSVSAGAFADVSRRGPEALRVIATQLNNPRKLFLAADGAIYVAEAGVGGQNRCVATKPQKSCVGLTGSITRISAGGQSRVLTHLVSVAYPSGGRAAGPADVIVQDNTYYLLIQDAFVKPDGTNVLGPDGTTAGHLISAVPAKAARKDIADLAAFEAAHNPDRGAGPGTKFGNPPIDSDPYAFVSYRGGFAVVDAAANDLLWISPGGRVSLLAVFPTRMQRLTPAEHRWFHIPVRIDSLAVQAVPSSVAIGPDDALYVGELTGLPFRAGSARIWRIVPGKKPTIYARGFTTISDLAFDGRALLVLQISANGLANGLSSGALIRLAPDGARAVLARAGLVAPTGLAVGNGTVYISNHGVSPGTGPGPHGQVIQLTNRRP
jgi:hypothetical protein